MTDPETQPQEEHEARSVSPVSLWARIVHRSAQLARSARAWIGQGLERLLPFKRQAARLEALEHCGARVEGSIDQLHAMVGQHVVALQIVTKRLDDAQRHLAELQATVTRLSAPSAITDFKLGVERERVDWALGALEGIAAQAEAYRAYRETDEYRAAYASAQPLVSICIPTMDRANLLLDRSLASVLAQTYHNLQIIIVGDNCTDDTMQRLAAVGDSRIQFVNLPERGPYPRPGRDRWHVAGTNAANRTLSLCEGQFVTHLDDDDRMEPQRIEMLVAAALQDQADFLWHAFLYEHRDGTWVKVGNERLEVGQVTNGSIFYHRYFARVPWDLYAYRLGEPGDWNRVRKIKLMRPRLRYLDESLLHHYVERAQPAFVPRQGERFLD